MRRALLVLVPFLSLGSSDGIDELFSLNVITHSNESSGRLQPLGFLTLVPDEFGTCLDGSPPGYYYRPGVGAGADKWMISIECTRVAVTVVLPMRLDPLSCVEWPKSHAFCSAFHRTFCMCCLFLQLAAGVTPRLTVLAGRNLTLVQVYAGGLPLY